MNERSIREGRPQTASEANMNDSAGVSPTLTYSMLKQATESWRHPSSNWSKSNLTTPTPGAKYGRKSKHWSIDLGPNSGAFLPVLNIQSQKAELSSRRNQKRNKSASTRRQHVTATNNLSTKAKSTSTAASILDLHSLNSQVNTDGSKLAPKLYRESSLPVHLGSISPMLKYSNESQNDFFMSRLALIETANRAGPSPEPESYDHSLNSVVSRASSKLTSTMPTPPTTSSTAETDNRNPNSTDSQNTARNCEGNTSTQPVGSASGITTVSTDSTTPTSNSLTSNSDIKPSISLSKGTHDVLDTRWHLNIRLPGENAVNPDEQRTPRADISNANKLDNGAPKSILKPKLTVNKSYDTNLTVPRKQALELSTYVLGSPLRSNPSGPTPPGNGSSRTSQRLKQRRVRLSQSSSMVSQSEEDSEANNEFTSGSVSSPTSVESNLQSPVNGSLNGEGMIDLQKSVRFCDKPAQVKEYFPWEAPLNSILI